MPAAALGTSPPQRRELASAVALALVYFAVAAASLINFGANPAIWVANAVAVTWIIREPPGQWAMFTAAVWLGSTCAVYLFGGGTPWLLGLADAGETLIVAWLMRLAGGPATLLSSVPGLVRFMLICLAVPAASSALGAAVLWWSEGLDFFSNWQLWYAASALGLLVVAPMLLVWRIPELRPRLNSAGLRLTALMASLLILLAALIFTVEFAAALFVLFPAVLLLVWSGGFAGASIGTAVVLAVGLWQTFAGRGAIAMMVYPATDLGSQIQGLQVYLAALTFATVPLAVVLTDQRRLATELARVAAARSDFLAAMSHEIRTPMTGVLGILDLLEAEDPTPKQRSYLHSIRDSGRHLLSVINDVLDFSRIETGRIELEQVDFSLPSLFEQLQSLLQPMSNERGLELRFELAEHSPPIVRGDPTRLRQVLLNLAGNAIKFTEEGGVTVRAGYGPNGDGRHRMRFEVEDSGIGIPADKQNEIFEAFTQADHSTTRRFGGSGLGLAISSRLVAAMGGKLGVKSEPGRGSCFWFEVPLEPGEAICPDPVAASGARVPDPRRILLAEDVELNREIIRTMLERDGHEVVVADNGEEAVELVRRSLFDLVLMDVHMPVMDGIEATRLIRKLPPPKGNIRIVALTANVMAGEQQKCRQAGMDDVLMKPVDWERVRACIGSAPRAHEPRRELPFDEDVFVRAVEVLPTASVAGHVEALATAVAQVTAAGGGGETESLEAAAHDIASQAGMLGLLRLSERALQLELACHQGGGIGSALEAFRAAADDIRLIDGAMPAKRARRSS